MGVGRYMFLCVGVCWGVLEYVVVFWGMFVYVGLCGRY